MKASVLILFLCGDGCFLNLKIMVEKKGAGLELSLAS